MVLRTGQAVAESVRRIMASLSCFGQRERLGESYERRSKQPGSRWTRQAVA